MLAVVAPSAGFLPLPLAWSHSWRRTIPVLLCDAQGAIERPAEHAYGEHADQPEYVIEGEHVGFARSGLAELRHALRLAQLRVVLVRGKCLALCLQPLQDTRIARYHLLGQMAGVVFLAYHLIGAEQRRSRQPAQALGHGEQHDEA